MSNFTTTNLLSKSKYSDEQQDALSNVSITLSSISLISCLFMILCWILFKSLRKLSYSFVCYMAIANALREIAKVLGGGHVNGDIMCILQGFLITYGGLSTFYWILSIAIIMYTIIFYPLKWSMDPNRTTKCNKISLIINFCVPLLFALLPLLFGTEYASTGGWCWIDGTSINGKIFRWLSYYGQLVLILIFCIFVYCRIYIYLEFDSSSPDIANIHKLYNRIKLYPLCLILGFTVAVIRRFVGLWDHHLGFGWAMAQSISTGLFGSMLFMIYGRLGKLNKLFKEKYTFCHPICDHLCCCLHSVKTIEENKDATKTQGNDERAITIDTEDSSQVPVNLSVAAIQMSASTQNVLQEAKEVFNQKHGN